MHIKDEEKSIVSEPMLSAGHIFSAFLIIFIYEKMNDCNNYPGVYKLFLIFYPGELRDF